MDHHKEFKKHLGAIFETESGKEALSYLKEIYVNSSCLDSTVERTYYRLGQKELIQGFIQTLNNPDELDEYVVYNN